ncbi:class I SAM-dependent methyltransferase [Rhodobacter sp. SGA-6-6]|uniref:class I SAM-dependent methyltransferase n=1 Tax=Rhodobacter sp. SGA-6-6 TaxID=2710882 RepID=UPI0013EC4087|nr:class I SAM-dependent methyltransferase [Rhodobacter sp. SGA-6-6]NGM46496.1 class I SAM-dependent methyltransferase [Rhodobacter sp. SGA-6-6]
MGFIKAIQELLRRRRLSIHSPQEIFSDYFRRNKWRDPDSRSGKGSNLKATAELRPQLPPLLAELGIRRLVDVPCGDFFWMQHVDLDGIEYLGGDIVPELIAANTARHGGPGRSFQVIDLIAGPVPKGDMVFTRDCLVHLSHEHVKRALDNIRASGSTWLLTTIYPSTPANEDILTGQWRALDLTKAPFNLPAPVRLIAEGAAAEKGQGPGKYLALWPVADLPSFVG